MSTKHCDAVRKEAWDHVRELRSPAHFTSFNGVSKGHIAESLLALIAKRDERIEALERRLAALEGDAK